MSATLRDRVIGAWELESFVAHDAATGDERRPLGARPRGLIMYTADGYMSAQLAMSDMTAYIAYGGRFTVDEGNATLHHDVIISMMPELLTQPQFRQATVDGDVLTLSAITTDASGVEASATLVWRRAAVHGD